MTIILKFGGMEITTDYPNYKIMITLEAIKQNDYQPSYGRRDDAPG